MRNGCNVNMGLTTIFILQLKPFERGVGVSHGSSGPDFTPDYFKSTVPSKVRHYQLVGAISPISYLFILSSFDYDDGTFVLNNSLWKAKNNG